LGTRFGRGGHPAPSGTSLEMAWNGHARRQLPHPTQLSLTLAWPCTISKAPFGQDFLHSRHPRQRCKSIWIDFIFIT